jgi:hypothetical protein
VIWILAAPISSQVPPAKPRLERFEPLKAFGGVTPVLNADLRGQKPMRRFRSPPNKSVTFVTAFSAFLSVSKYGAVKLFESPGRAGGLPM